MLLLIAVILIISGCSTKFPKACTEEAKLCPNGRAVGRVGPNCEFAPCELPASLDECNTKDGFWKDWCYLDYASEVAKDPEICSMIKSTDLRESCYSRSS